ncbi:MAG TPA: NAD-dependent epimerase/dehydratase family protein [Pirellulaceae bacterium]|nr:NAD-dependent epimerase/dehydratase family protein [Pirellulaceae bacterium]
MTTLVTGATGLVGNNVVRLLRNAGKAVRVLVRETSDPRPLAGLDVEVVTGDVCEVESVRRAMAGISRVVHSAAQVHIGWTGLESQRAINVEGTRNVATAALAAHATMVHVSSVDALGVGSPDLPADEESPREGKVLCSYVLSKRESEQVFLEEVGRGLEGVVVNPGLMFGPWDWKPSSGRMLLEVARRFTPFAPKGGCSVCDVRDVAAGIIAALERGTTGRRYILAGENVTYLDLWKRITRLTGGTAPICRAGPLMRIIAGRGGDLIGKLTGREPDVNSAAVGMSDLYHYYSIARAEEELGYVVRPLEESIADAWSWFQAEGYA